MYRVAPQDILGITVWDHPELTTPQGSTLSTGGNTTQTRRRAPVQQPYTAALPGQADPYGQTVCRRRHDLLPVRRQHAGGGQDRRATSATSSRKVSRRIIRNPQVDVRVLSYRSQKVQVTGEVKTPGPLAVSDVPLTLVDAITRSGGTTADADIQRVRLTRNGKLYVLDADSVLDRGDIEAERDAAGGRHHQRAGPQRQPHLRDGRGEDAAAGHDVARPSDDRRRAHAGGRHSRYRRQPAPDLRGARHAGNSRPRRISIAST